MTEEKKRRGFATMPREAVAEIARKGGKAAQATGRGHRFTREEARENGRKGGRTSQANRRAREAAVEQHEDQKYNR